MRVLQLLPCVALSLISTLYAAEKNERKESRDKAISAKLIPIQAEKLSEWRKQHPSPIPNALLAKELDPKRIELELRISESGGGALRRGRAPAFTENETILSGLSNDSLYPLSDELEKERLGIQKRNPSLAEKARSWRIGLEIDKAIERQDKCWWAKTDTEQTKILERWKSTEERPALKDQRIEIEETNGKHNILQLLDYLDINAGQTPARWVSLRDLLKNG